MAKDTRLQKMLAECGIASRRKALKAAIARGSGGLDSFGQAIPCRAMRALPLPLWANTAAVVAHIEGFGFRHEESLFSWNNKAWMLHKGTVSRQRMWGKG